jgi:hypothetical protein
MSGSVSFVCVVESGWLESQAVRLVESLRRHGGKYANAPIYAVTPRFGPPLRRATRDKFEQHVVRYLRSSRPRPYDWFKFINKPRAIAMAEKHATTDVICWLDSDLLILSSPDALELTNEDFAACASDKEMGSSGPGDAFEPLWIELCKTAGVPINTLPWLTTENDHKRIRAYWNGGLFAFRRATGFGSEYLRVCHALLDAKVVSAAPGYSTGINEMSALGLAMARLKLRWRALPFFYNYPVGPKVPREWYTPDRAKQVKIMHYHDAMWPWYWSTFIERLTASHPQAAAWLAPLGAIKVESPIPSRLLGRALKEIRNRREAMYRAGCRSV